MAYPASFGPRAADLPAVPDDADPTVAIAAAAAVRTFDWQEMDLEMKPATAAHVVAALDCAAIHLIVVLPGPGER